MFIQFLFSSVDIVGYTSPSKFFESIDISFTGGIKIIVKSSFKFRKSHSFLSFQFFYIYFFVLSLEYIYIIYYYLLLVNTGLGTYHVPTPNFGIFFFRI